MKDSLVNVALKMAAIFIRTDELEKYHTAFT
jgi:hypothetical protein